MASSAKSVCITTKLSAVCVALRCAAGRRGACSGAGLFLAPQMVGEALKGGRLVAAVMEGRGFRVTPGSGALALGSAEGAPARPSFITAVQLGSAARMVAFCRAVQRSSPVGAYVQPVPGAHWAGLGLGLGGPDVHNMAAPAMQCIVPTSQ